MRALTEGQPDAALPAEVFALVVGAGFAGIAMGVALRKAGIDDFLVLEKAAGPGGVWQANSYPGAACDVPSHLYSFSFEPWSGWSRRYAPQAEIQAYLEHCVAKYGLVAHLRCSCPVLAAAWDEPARRWRVRLGDGRTVTARVLLPACGQLSQPAWPALPGLERFEGPCFHSARWDHAVELAGKRVGVIGTGASAIQFVPEVARTGDALTVFQRTPPYVFPKVDWAYGPVWRRLYRRVPGLRRLSRWLQYLSHETRGFVLLRVRPIVKLYEWRYRRILRRRIDDPALRRALTPDHPLGCKRILFSNRYLQALNAPHVTVESKAIEAVTARGIRTADGRYHRLDVLILGTGFRATDFLGSLDVAGRGGRRLADYWREGAHAYLGMAVPGFPNLFLLYGPNTNLGHNSIIFILERQTAYLVQALQALCADHDLALEVDAAHEARYDARLQAALDRSIWAGGCDNWYKNDAGRIVNNWPDLTVTYARRVRRFDAEHYVRR